MSTLIQLLRFAAVGVISNVVLYLLYLALTAVGLGYKTAMTIAYCVGVMQTFVVNKRWTFEHGGLLRRSFIRYVALYLCGYLLNLAAMIVFVDIAGFKHQIVQGLSIIFIAALLFVLQKFWVFRKGSPRTEPPLAMHRRP